MFKDVDVQEIEKKKKEQEHENQRKPTNMKERFGSSNLDLLEEEFKNKTVGLVTREEFKRKRENIDNIIEQDLFRKKQAEGAKRLKEKQQRKEQHKKSTTLLSFDVTEHDEAEEIIQIPKAVEKVEEQQELDSDGQEMKLYNKPLGYGKDQKVNTVFLPDGQRDQLVKQLRKQFADEFHKEQDVIKNQLIDLKFQYWDGSYIVKSLTIKKNTTILKFLEEARKEIIKDFAFIKEFAAEDLIIVVKDMILPHKLTFYDLIANKVRNKSGHPLFIFDRMKVSGGGVDYEVEVEKSCTAKIIEKFKYDKISHIYPCSIWEVVDINRFR